jgi:hypothetical protein
VQGTGLGQARLRGQITHAGRSSASAIQAMFSTCATVRRRLAAASGTVASPPPRRQALAIESMV